MLKLKKTLKLSKHSKRSKRSKLSKKGKKGGAFRYFLDQSINPDRKDILERISELSYNLEKVDKETFAKYGALQNVYSLMSQLDQETPASKNPFDFKYVIPFPRADEICKTPKSCSDWYMKVNPEFIPFDKKVRRKVKGVPEELLDIDIRIPLNGTDVNAVCDYEPLVIGMIRDLCLVCVLLENTQKLEHMKSLNEYMKEKYQDQNTILNLMLSSEKGILNKPELLEKAMECLFKFEQLISESGLKGRGYIYTDFIDCMTEYLKFFSVGAYNFDLNDTHKKISRYNESYNFLKNIVKGPYMLFPTFKQLNFTKVINLLGSNIGNFRLLNNQGMIHNNSDGPLTEITHDIMSHGDITHNSNRSIFKDRQTISEFKFYEQLSLKNNIHYFYPPFVKEIFIKRSQNLNKIYQYYNYNPKIINSDGDVPMDEQDKYFMAVILFIICHERNVSKETFEGYFLDNLLSDIYNFFKNDILNLDGKNKINVEYFENMKEDITFNGKPRFISQMNIKEFQDRFIKLISNVSTIVEQIDPKEKQVFNGRLEMLKQEEKSFRMSLLD